MDFDPHKLTELASLYGLKLLGALAILVFGRWGLKLAVAVARRLMLASRVDETLVAFTGNVCYALGLAFVVIAALSQLGIQTTSLAAIFGAAGLAIGLSLQNALGNLAAGVMLIALRPFKLGDTIETAGKAGKITDLNVFTTTLVTAEGLRVIIPNGKITADTIVNHSR